MSEDPQKIGRTIRLTSDMNQRLLDLCSHIGTNPNAYMVTEIGKCVARDEVSLYAKTRTRELFDVMADLTERIDE